MICLVSGATGFIGSHICRALLKKGHHVRALCRPNSNRQAIVDLDVDCTVGDILEPQTLLPAMQGVDWLFHTAAQAAHWRDDSWLTISIVEGTKNVIEAAHMAGIRRLIYTSSSAALGIPKDGEILSENHQAALSFKQWPYGFAKREAEKEVILATQTGLNCVIVNPTTVLGPGDLNAISGSLIILMAHKEIPFLTNGSMNIVHIDDIVSGHIAAAEFGECGQRYILGGQNISNQKLLRMIAEECSVPTPKITLPSIFVRVTAAALEMASPFVRLPFNTDLLRLSTYQFQYDTSKANRDLYMPDPLPIRTALSEAVDWYKENGYL